MNQINQNSFRNCAFIIASALLFFMSANMQAQIAIGGGLGYNEKVSGAGVTAKAQFNITNEIAISPGFTYFFGTAVYGFNQNMIAVDVNGHYFFDIMDDKLKIYPLVGLNFSSYKTGYSNYYFQTSEVSNSTFGANIGAGAQYKFTEKLSVYLEPKYVASEFGQVIVNAGILYQL
ncbi:outer membrane protein [Bizionia argentinensis]|uniref:outer membrane protein n=1 Tax=Bizionia argentinensis TaxID=456455 RepID=UPI001ED8FBE9|nr:outer membrane beta-barrel protein [Bizionia argentinensis]